jgi:hypothetical protein
LKGPAERQGRLICFRRHWQVRQQFGDYHIVDFYQNTLLNTFATKLAEAGVAVRRLKGAPVRG